MVAEQSQAANDNSNNNPTDASRFHLQPFSPYVPACTISLSWIACLSVSVDSSDMFTCDGLMYALSLHCAANINYAVSNATTPSGIQHSMCFIIIIF